MRKESRMGMGRFGCLLGLGLVTVVPLAFPKNADADTATCTLPVKADCSIDPYLEGWWEGTCTGATAGGKSETYALKFEVRPSGYQALGAGPTYNRFEGKTKSGVPYIGEGTWVNYWAQGTLTTAKGQEVRSNFLAQQTSFLQCLTATCSIDPKGEYVSTLVIDKDAMFTPSGSVPKGYVWAGARSGKV